MNQGVPIRNYFESPNVEMLKTIRASTFRFRGDGGSCCKDRPKKRHHGAVDNEKRGGGVNSAAEI